MSSLASSCGGRPPEQRSCRATAPSFVDAAHSPRIRVSRRVAAAFSLGRQPEESGMRGNQPQSGDSNATTRCSSFNRVLPLLCRLAWWRSRRTRSRRTRCDQITESLMGRIEITPQKLQSPACW